MAREIFLSSGVEYDSMRIVTLKVFPVIFNWPMACAWIVSGFISPHVPASKSNPAGVAPASK